MAQIYLNDDGDIMISDGNLQDIINQYSVDGTGDISDLGLPTSGEWSSGDYEEGSDWFISTEQEEMIMQEIFTLEQLKADGLEVIHLKDDYTIFELLLVGFTLLELYEGEIAPNLLVEYGFTFKQLIDAGVNDILFTLNTSAQQITLVENIVDDINNEFYFDIDEQDIYITHKNDNKIIKITESSSVYTSIDLITSGLNKPSGIIKRNNELFISNAGDHTIIISDLNGNINDGVYAGNHLGLSGDNDNTNTLRFENNNYNIEISEFNSLINNPGEMFLDNTDILFLDKGNKSVKTINYTQLGNTFNQNDIIYISNSDSHTISRYFDNALSEWIGKDGVFGDVDGNSETTRLNKPGDLLIEQVNNIDHLYFLDKGNNALKTINTSYPISCTKIIDGFNNPEGFMKDNDEFYVADTGNNKIIKITPEAGGYSSSDFATGIPSPKDIIKYNDLLFVSCGDHSIKRISSDGTFTTVSGLENNSGLINGLDAILEFDDFKQKNRPSRYNNPNQMQLDNSNNLLIVDTNNNVIRNLEIKPVVNTTYTGIHYIAQEEGTIKKYIPTAYPPLIDFVESLNNPVKLALKGDDIFVCNTGDNELAIINPTTGTKTTISNTLNNPNSILIEGDDLYVADTDNNKIVKLAIFTDWENANETKIVVASDAATDDRFGHSVAIDGNYAIVGGPYNDDPTDSGSVYIFNVTTGAQLHKLTAGDAAANDQFGHSVGISGNYAIVGAYGKDFEINNFVYSPLNAAIQLGNDIDGEAAGDESGYSVSLSSDGSIVAIGARYNDVNINDNRGHVRVYQWNGTAWTQLGQDIDGEAADDYSGISVSLSSDGTILAIGAYANDENGGNAGHVRVYQWNGTTWTQLGQDIDGEAEFDNSGRSVSLSSDGTIVAIGAPNNEGVNGANSGHVRVYQWNGTAWTQLGQDIDGEAAEDYSGRSVSLSQDGTILAIGAWSNDGNDIFRIGHVRVYQYNGTTWTQLGQDIDGEALDDQSGLNINLSSDGTTVAIGAQNNHGINGPYSGHVRVYQWNGTAWTQLGQDIDGEAASDFSGQSVSLSSDGTILVVGAINNDGNGSNSGHVRVYQWNGTDTWTQLGQDINGEAAGDKSGYSVSLSSDGTILAIGAPYNDGVNGSDSGHVRVYKIADMVEAEPVYTPLDVAVQLGQDIDGEVAGDQIGDVMSFWEPGSSISINQDGTIVAIGAQRNDTTNGINSGQVRVYQYSNNSWTQLGSDINGEAANDYSGVSVSLSDDGTIVAIGAPYNDGTTGNTDDGRGHVRVYQYSNGSWTQLGNDIDGEAAGDESGYSVSLSSDGTIVAIGAIGNDENGRVRVFQYANNAWTQLGNDIDDEAPSDEGGVVSLNSDGTIVAIGAPKNAGDKGHVRVYQYANNTWTQLGSDIDGEAAGDYSGDSVSLSSDGTIVAIGAHGNDVAGAYAGHVRVYQYSSGSWTQLGNDIDGEAAGDHFGKNVSLSGDGTIVAIGAYANDGNGTDSGHVRIYQWNGTAWTQLGSDIDGEAAGDRSGVCISLSRDGSKVAIGAPYNDGTSGNTSDNRGHVRVYKLWETITNTTIVSNSGSAYIFDVTTGAQLHKLTAGDAAANDQFGHSVAISGNYAIVGAYDKDFEINNFVYTPLDVAVQLGNDIDGGASGDKSGWSVSMNQDGTIVAIGAPYNDGVNGSDSGRVRVFQYANNAWTQLGSDIVAEASGDKSGWSVSLSSDGTIVAIGAPNNDGTGNSAGHVRVYQYSSSSWTQLGSDIDGEAGDDRNGYSVSLSSDGTIVACGAVYAHVGTNETGHVRVYQYANNAWTQLGSDIDGAAHEDEFGYSVSLSSDGTIVAIGAIYDDGVDSGYVRVFQYSNNAWVQLGSDINGVAGNESANVSLSDDGTIVAIGAYGNSNSAGYVRVYQYSSGSWTQLGSNINGAANDGLGNSVSLSSNGTIIAIGGSFKGNNTGVVKVFRWNGSAWTQSGSDIDAEAASDEFGYSVSLSSDGSIVAIGAPNNDGNGAGSGHVRIYKLGETITNTTIVSNSSSAYIFNVTTGAELHKIVASDAATNDWFGYSVAISGNYVIVGAYKDDVPNDSGSAYIFNVTTGAQLHKLTASDAAQDDNFGYSVAIDGNYAIVGARYEDDGGTNSGSAYIYNVTTGAELHKLTASDAASSDYFGWSVAISGNYAIVGAKFDDDTASYSGSAYIFDVTTGAQIHKLDASDAAGSDFFGKSVAISSDNVIVGAYGKNNVAGTAYIYSAPIGFKPPTDFATGITSPKDIVKNSDGNFFISTGENTIIRINSTNVKETISGVKNQTNNINGTDIIEYIEISFEASLVDDDNLMKVDTLFQSRYNSPEYMLLLDVNNILLVDKGNNEIKNLNITYSSYTNTGALFVTENNFHTVKKVDLQGKISAFAGIEDDKGTTNGALGVNKFDSPKGLTQDANRNLLIVDSANNQIRKIDKTTGITTVFASGFNNPTDIVKVADTTENANNYETFLVSDTDSHKIKKIIAKNPVEVSDYIGSGVAGHFDGVGVLAELNKPEGLYFDSSGNVFIADSGTHSIRKIESDGKVITESGLPNVSGQNNGQGNNANFNSPNSLTMINNKLYISDSNNHAIREGIITYDAGGIFDEIPIQTIKASDEIVNNYFGQAVSCDDNYLLISSKHTDNKGKVYVYKISGDQWIEIATIQPNDLVINDEFGKSLVIYNNTAFIGCENKNDKKGMVYIYQKQLLDDSTWNLIQVLEGSDTDKDYLFGKTISVYNEELFIGSPKVENSGLVGQVYRFKYNDIAGLTGYWGIYQNNKWNESEIITPDDSEINDQFGCSIQLSNTFAIIGAKYKNLNNQSGNTGTVYTYVKKSPNIWLQLNTDPLTIEVTTGDEYGITVGLSKTAGEDYTNQQTIIIGAWKKDNPENSGRVYLYNLSSIPSNPVIYTLAFDSRTKEWKSEYLSDLVPALPTDGGMGEYLIYDGNTWNTSSNGWIIENINQPINIIEKNLATSGSWSSDIINL